MDNELNEQEDFWKNKFGDDYSSRKNNNFSIIEQRTSEFERYLKSTKQSNICIRVWSKYWFELKCFKIINP